jgi:hypothetical protein
VHISSSKTVDLFHQPAGGSGFVLVCRSPCDLELPLGGLYRIAGGGRRSSDPFRLRDGEGERVELGVGPDWLGIALSGGLAAVLTGVLVYIAATATPSRDWSGFGQVAIFGVGLAPVALLCGAGFYFANSTTVVTQRSRSIQPSSHSRLPSWRPAMTAMEEPLLQVPLVQLAF